MKPPTKTTLTKEIEKRAHSIEGQGDGIYFVFIRMDEIIAAALAYSKYKAAAKRRKKK